MCIRSVRALWVPFLVSFIAVTMTVGCGGEEGQKSPAPAAKAPAAPVKAKKKAGPPPTADELPQALVLGLAQFPPREKGALPKALPATMSFLVRRGGEWEVVEATDDRSDVFHKVLYYKTPEGEDRILTGAGSAAILALWEKGPDGYSAEEAEVLWQKDFGGKFSRMRDVEIADVFGDGRDVIVVATHDQGVVAIVTPQPGGGYEVQELDEEADIFVHEVETGDLDGDGVVEIYATPSEPNKLDGGEQSRSARRQTFDPCGREAGAGRPGRQSPIARCARGQGADRGQAAGRQVRGLR